MMWSAFAVVLFGLLNSCSTQERKSVKESALTFDVGGKTHHESRRLEDDVVTFTDAEDGFLTVLDYKRGIFMVKNTTTQTCYFSTLENIPYNRDEEKPIFVKEVKEYSELESELGENADVVLFTPAGTLPKSYVRVTNDARVVGRCSSQPSYWLETKSISRKRRAKCEVICGAVILGIGFLAGKWG